MATKKQKQEDRIEEIRKDAIKNYKSLLKRKRTYNKWIQMSAQLEDEDLSMIQKLNIMEEMQSLVFGDSYDEILDLIEEVEEFDQFYLDIVNDESLKK